MSIHGCILLVIINKIYNDFVKCWIGLIIFVQGYTVLILKYVGFSQCHLIFLRNSDSQFLIRIPVILSSNSETNLFSVLQKMDFSLGAQKAKMAGTTIWWKAVVFIFLIVFPFPKLWYPIFDLLILIFFPLYLL